MFDKRLITKTYKFIYIDRTNCDYDDRGAPTDYGSIYTFGNVAPKGLNTATSKRKRDKFGTRWKISEFFSRSGVELSGKKNTEASITLAMVRHWEGKISRNIAEQDELITAVKEKRGAYSLHLLKLAKSRLQSQLKGYKFQLKYWQRKYKAVEKLGVYTWLALNE